MEAKNGIEKWKRLRRFFVIKSSSCMLSAVVYYANSADKEEKEFLRAFFQEIAEVSEGDGKEKEMIDRIFNKYRKELNKKIKSCEQSC